MHKNEVFINEILLLIVKNLLPGSIQMSIPPANISDVSEIKSNSKSLLALYEIFEAIEGSLSKDRNQGNKEGFAEEVFFCLLNDPVLYSQVARAVAEPLLTSYYQRPDVLQGLGLDNKAPFPQGNVLKQSDLSMLEPVYLRGSIYKEVDEG